MHLQQPVPGRCCFKLQEIATQSPVRHGAGPPILAMMARTGNKCAQRGLLTGQRTWPRGHTMRPPIDTRHYPGPVAGDKRSARQFPVSCRATQVMSCPIDLIQITSKTFRLMQSQPKSCHAGDRSGSSAQLKVNGCPRKLRPVLYPLGSEGRACRGRYRSQLIIASPTALII